jgi:MFS family permease
LPEPDRSESRFRAEVAVNLRRNYLAHLSHGLFGQTGMRLINAPVFVPAYIHALAGSDVVVGLARGLQYLGMFLSPVLGATLVEHRRRVLPVGLLFGGLMRLAILGIALAGLLLPPQLALPVTCGMLGAFGFFLGIQGVVFNVLVAKVIPVDRRGVLVGLRNALAGCTAYGVSIYAGVSLIEADALGNGYAATFLLAFALTAAGLTMLLFVREPEQPEVRPSVGVRERLADLPGLLRSDPGFTRYFLARALAVMGRMAMPFYVLYAAQRLSLGGPELGVLSGAFVLSTSVGNLFWGMLADRRGFRLVYLVALGLWVLSVLGLMQIQDFASLVAIFVGIGAGLGGYQMSAQNLVLEFGSRRNLPLRIAVANSASELVAATGAVAGGILSALFSYEAVFWIAIAFQLAGLAVVLLGVDDPRHRR